MMMVVVVVVMMTLNVFFVSLCDIIWYHQSSMTKSKRPSDYHNENDNRNMIAIGDRKGGDEFKSIT